MKIPPVGILNRFVVQKKSKNSMHKLPLPPLTKDTISFTSTAYYLKKYNTLPEEIKKILKPQDAIDMFKNMEMIQNGTRKGIKIGQGNYSRVYENPWLDDYYLLISQKPTLTNQVIYSRYSLGDSVWSDRDNEVIQIIKKAKAS